MLDDPDDNGWYGQAQAADATFVHEVGELERDDSQESWQDDPDTDRWHVPARAAELSSAPEADDLPRDDAYDDVWGEPRENVGWPVRPPQWQKRHTPYRRVELYGVQAAALVPEQACEDWAYRSRGGGDRGAARSARGAQSRDRCRGVDDGAIKSAH